MARLPMLEPRLIGSVATGHVRAGSDIDLHVFADDPVLVEERLFALGWVYEMSMITVNTGSAFRDFHHAYVEREFPVELSIYPHAERRIATRSSTDGKRIDRVSSGRLRQLLANQHPEEWLEYQQNGLDRARVGELIDADSIRSLADVEADDP